jgi:hypothetical protein
MTEHRLAVRHFAWLAIILTGALLQACGPNDKGAAGPKQRVFAADVAGGAKVCEVPKVSPTNDQPTEAAIKMTNDGGWCGLPVHRSELKPFSAGLLSTRPSHGTVVIHQVGDETRIDYTPDRGFAGTDSFVVKLLPGNASVRVTATVSGPVA